VSYNISSSSSLSSVDVDWNGRNTNSTSYKHQRVSVHNERGMIFVTIIVYNLNYSMQSVAGF